MRRSNQSSVGGQATAVGTLKVSIIDEETNGLTPARVELLDTRGSGYVAEDALLYGGDSRDYEKRWTGTVEEALAYFSTRTVKNRYSGTDQFYSAGTFQDSLPASGYTLRVFKGLEYHMATRQVQILADRTTELVLKLGRWINLPKLGWYGADSHVHIARPFKEMNAPISKQMQAEDLHVVNLLEWGWAKRFHNAPQYAHGPDGSYHEGNYWLVSGQENPRTNFLGHTIIFGEKVPIHFPDSYLLYNQFWSEADRQGALSGWAHFAIDRGGRGGIATDVLDGLISFLEVLQFDELRTEVWYDVLNLGQRVAPVAGTDYMPPNSPYLPGRERFYTRLEGPLTFETWLDGVRRGRTFVTNGPMLDWSVDGRGTGDELLLKAPAMVRIQARVQFDPERDSVERLEVVANGEVVKTFTREANASEIVGEFDYLASECCWLAVRASGDKLIEARTRLLSLLPRKDPRYREQSPSLAHSGAIYITVENTAPLRSQSRAKAIAKAWLERLHVLEQQLAADQLEKLLVDHNDGVDLEYLRKGQPALLDRIASAKKRFEEIAR